MDINKRIEDRLQNYFNIVLKNSLGYPELFTVNSNVDSKRITLSSDRTSQLVNKLNQNKKLTSSIEASLLNGFKSFDPSVSSIAIVTLSTNELEIKYTTQKMLPDLDIIQYANITSNFTIN